MNPKPNSTKFGNLAIGDHFILDGIHLVKRELRQKPGDAFPLNACAQDDGPPFCFVGDEILVTKT